MPIIINKKVAPVEPKKMGIVKGGPIAPPAKAVVVKQPVIKASTAAFTTAKPISPMQEVGLEHEVVAPGTGVVMVAKWPKEYKLVQRGDRGVVEKHNPAQHAEERPQHDMYKIRLTSPRDVHNPTTWVYRKDFEVAP